MGVKLLNSLKTVNNTHKTKYNEKKGSRIKKGEPNTDEANKKKETIKKRSENFICNKTPHHYQKEKIQKKKKW